MVDETESLNSDAQSAVSSEPQNEVATNESGAPEQSEAQSNQSAEKETPFHEHPRFKELVEQKNAYQAQFEAMQQKLQQMENQFKGFKQPAPKQNPLVERLKGIDPEFGQWVEEQAASKEQLETIKQWQYQMELQSLRSQAENTLNDLNTKASVPEEQRELYNDLVKSKIIAIGDGATMDDLVKAHREVHSKLGKMFNNVQRTTTQQYAQSKKADAKIPATQVKGKPSAPASKEFEFQGTPDEIKAQRKAAVLRALQEGSDL